MKNLKILKRNQLKNINGGLVALGATCYQNGMVSFINAVCYKCVKGRVVLCEVQP